MKQQLWILNSSLILFFAVVLVVLPFLHIEPPRLVITRAERIAPEEKETMLLTSWEKIYKNDLFKTFSPPPPPPPAKKIQAPPLPQAEEPSFSPPPPLPKQEFIDPLGVTIKGLIISSEEEKSVALLEDETKKEGLYHLGDKLRDGQIIRITRNSVTFLRANGQQEIFLLKKEEPLIPSGDAAEVDKWSMIIKKQDETSYEVDPDAFSKEIETLGNFIENVGVTGTVYHDNKPIGIAIGDTEGNELAAQLGLQPQDVIISINNLSLANKKNRITILDTILESPLGTMIPVVIKRGNASVTLTYTLAKINKQRKPQASTNAEKIPGEQSSEQTPKKEPEMFPMNKLQEREQQLRQFKQQHQQNQGQQQASIEKIRQRLLENLRNRIKNARVR